VAQALASAERLPCHGARLAHQRRREGRCVVPPLIVRHVDQHAQVLRRTVRVAVIAVVGAHEPRLLMGGSVAKTSAVPVALASPLHTGSASASSAPGGVTESESSGGPGVAVATAIAPLVVVPM